VTTISLTANGQVCRIEYCILLLSFQEQYFLATVPKTRQELSRAEKRSLIKTLTSARTNISKIKPTAKMQK
jgi:hypothetical protein